MIGNAISRSQFAIFLIDVSWLRPVKSCSKCGCTAWPMHNDASQNLPSQNALDTDKTASEPLQENNPATIHQIFLIELRCNAFITGKRFSISSLLNAYGIVRKMMNSRMIKSLCLIIPVLLFGCVFVHLLFHVYIIYAIGFILYVYRIYVIGLLDLFVMFTGFICHIYMIYVIYLQDIYMMFTESICKVIFGGKYILFMLLHFIIVIRIMSHCQV